MTAVIQGHFTTFLGYFQCVHFVSASILIQKFDDSCHTGPFYHLSWIFSMCTFCLGLYPHPEV